MSLLRDFASVSGVAEEATAWEFCTVWFRKRLIDGTYANSHLMRRRFNGEWQYRHLNAEDEAEWLSANSW